jgi:sortase A
LGTWLIGLGYLVVVLSTVNIIRDWISEAGITEFRSDLSASSQGFVPYLDAPETAHEGGKSDSSGSAAQQPAITSPERQATTEQDAIENLPEEQTVEVILEKWVPEYLSIPTIDLDVPITAAEFEKVDIFGETYRQWLAPDSRRVGWQPSSASLGAQGNSVLIGHHNVHGEVFRNLDQLEIGDKITVYSGDRVFEYLITLKMILPEKYESVETRLENARWIQPMQDERITLVTCWPYETNTHRVILVAEPVSIGTEDGWETRYMDP